MIADLLSRRKDFEKGVNINENVTLLPENLFAKKVSLENNPETRHKILYDAHNTPVAGHPGISNIRDIIKQQYEGPKLCQFVKEYVKGCAKCQESKVITHIKRAPLYHFDTYAENRPFQYVSMDLIMDLPLSNKHDAILTIVDQGCSKVAKFIPCNKTIDGQGVARLYFQHLFPWFGILKRIISDRDPCFTSHFSTAVCKATGIQQNISTAFHPCTDGQTEQMNLWIKNYLKKFISTCQNDWSAFLPMAEFTHNSWRHEHTRHTSHKLLIEINPTALINIPEDSVPATHDRLAELRNMRIRAQQALQRRIKATTPPCVFTPGDKVWLDA